MGTRTEPMAATDAFSWNMERDPALRSTVVAVMWLDRAPDWDRLTDRIDRMTRLMPNLRMRVLPAPLPLATPRWATEETIDLGWHLRRMVAPEPGNRDVVLEVARQAAMEAFDKDRPLWVFTLVEGLADGGAGFVVKVHHSLTDGVGGMKLLGALLDLERDPATQLEAPPPAAPSEVGRPALLRDTAVTLAAQGVQLARRGSRATVAGLWHGVRDPLGAARAATDLAGSVYRTAGPLGSTLSPVMRDRATTRRLATMGVPLDVLRGAARQAGVSVNDAFLAAVTGGLRRYHEKHQRSVDRLRVTMPVSIRRDEDHDWGNRITLLRVTLPVAEEDPVTRMQAIQVATTAARHERSLPITDVIAGGLNLLPVGYVGGVLKHVDFLASNVPGVPVPLYVEGAKLTGFSAFGPTIGAALNLTLISYVGHCDIGVNIDTAAVPDAELMLACLEEGFAEVAELARVHERPE